jgi:hypothetical protein
VSDFNTLLSSYRHIFQTNNKEASELNCTTDQMDLTNIYVICHPKATEYCSLYPMEFSPKQITWKVNQEIRKEKC